MNREPRKSVISPSLYAIPTWPMGGKSHVIIGSGHHTTHMGKQFLRDSTGGKDLEPPEDASAPGSRSTSSIWRDVVLSE